MQNTARKYHQNEVTMVYGAVAASTGAVLTVGTDLGELPARRARGCLVKPADGDLVLLAVSPAGVYVLQVLERPAELDEGSELDFEGPVRVRVEQGGLNLAAAVDITLTAPQLEIEARRGKVAIEDCSFFGRLFSGRVEKLKMAADTLDAIFRRAVQRLTNSYRYVEEHDEVQSGSTRFLVDGTMTMQTKTTMHTAEGHIKIDAEQIHLG
jgi:hypothetical protein